MKYFILPVCLSLIFITGCSKNYEDSVNLFSRNLKGGNLIKTTLIPDDNFEQYLIDNGYDDELDNVVLTINIIDVQEVIIDGYTYPVESLEGLHDFSSLTTLSLAATLIPELNISKNKSLINLFLYENLNLQTLNVTNNRELKRIFLEQSRIQYLDLSNNIKLESLSTVDGNLSYIDISKNKNLQYLYLEDNNITSLDVSKNINLKSVFTNTTLIRALDFSKNKNLTDLGLEITGPSEGFILDISDTKSLEYLSIEGGLLETLDISSNINLSRLYLYGNRLNALDISNNSMLSVMDVRENPLECIQVNETQLNNIPSDWLLDPEDSFSLNCSDQAI